MVIAGASAACERSIDRLHSGMVSICGSGRVFRILLRSRQSSAESFDESEMEVAA